MSKQTIENRYKIQKIDAIGRILVPIAHTVCYTFAVAFFSYCVYKSIYVLSGKETNAKLLLNLLADLKMDQWTAYILASLGAVYGVSEHQQRKRVIQQKSKRIQELELRINSNRQTSMLAEDGSTRKGDVI